jgi:hypothetical protein
MNMRSAVLVSCLTMPCSGLAELAPRVYQFSATLDGKPIGDHRFEVRAHGGRNHVTSRARFKVKFLMFTAYRYRHEATEVWDGACLARIDAHTDDNGRKYAVTGERLRDRFWVSAAGAARELPGCVLSFAYWDPRILEAKRLLNAQTGDYHAVTVAYLGADPVPVGGVSITAERWRLSAEDLEIDLWYAPDGRWLALESEAAGGRRLRYTLEQ